MLYVRYVHLTKGQVYSLRDKHIVSSERMLRKDYYRKGSVEKKNLWSYVSTGLTLRRSDWL
jgi:hypothetical protein